MRSIAGMLDPQIRDLAQAKNFAALTVIPANGHPMTLSLIHI